MADYRMYEDNLGFYGGRYYPGLGRSIHQPSEWTPSRNYSLGQAPAKFKTGQLVEAKLREKLRHMTQAAVDGICAKLRDGIAAAAAQAYDLHVKKKMPRGQAIQTAVNALLKVCYQPKYHRLWRKKR